MRQPHAEREYYKSFDIVLRKKKGQFITAAWFPHYKEKCQYEGSSRQECLKHIKCKIDTIIADNLPRFQDEIRRVHAENLKDIGAPNHGIGEIRLKTRVNHCNKRKCRRTVDNTYDLECLSCGWIVCARCGSCGCNLGYIGRAPHNNRHQTPSI